MAFIHLVDRLNRLICWLLAALMLGMTLCTLWQVVVRFLLTSLNVNVAAPWSEEIARYLMIWVIFLGAGVACRRAQLIALELLVTRLPARLGRLLRYLALLGCMAFFVLLIVLGLDFMAMGVIETSPVLTLPKTWVYLAMPVGAGLMLLNTLALIGECGLTGADIRYAGQSAAPYHRQE